MKLPAESCGISKWNSPRLTHLSILSGSLLLRMVLFELRRVATPFILAASCRVFWRRRINHQVIYSYSGEAALYRFAKRLYEVTQLGKIFEALEKSKKNGGIAASKSKNGGIAENDSSGRQDAPGDSATFPDMDDNIDENLVTYLKPQSFESEQFKILRSKLLFPASGKPARTIMVTSALPGEGKSFVAVNLAVSIAQGMHEHVLIMDCDMRMPSIHQRFGFGNVPGLSEYLSGEKPLSSLLLKTKIEKLGILPGGTPPHNPSELLASQQMSQLLKEVKERYDNRYIIIDSPPPKLTAEAHAISRQVDGILLVVKYRNTPRKMISDIAETMGKEKIIGVILNNFDMPLSNYFMYKKYGKYRDKGKYYTK